MDIILQSTESFLEAFIVLILSTKNTDHALLSIGVEEKTFYSFLDSTLTDAIISVNQTDNGEFVLLFGIFRVSNIFRL